MRRVRHLLRLQRPVLRRLERLTHHLSDAEALPPSQTREILCCHATIDALNTWSSFLRAYFLSGMISAKRLGSARISVSSPEPLESRALGRAILFIRPKAKPKADGSWDRRDEPPWHDTTILLSLLRQMKFSNESEIAAALSSGTRVFNDLPVFRNFYAHRNRLTRMAACNLAPHYGIPADRSPTEILLSLPLRRPQTLFADWLDDLRFTIEYMCC